jgi:hypothetical protein
MRATALDRQFNKKGLIENRFDSYKTFFDRQWADRLIKTAATTVFGRAAFDFIVATRHAANTHMLPWLVVDQLRHFYRGVMEQDEPFAVQLANAAILKLEVERGEGLPGDVSRHIRVILREASVETMRKRKRVADGFNIQSVWEEYLESKEFSYCIVGSQRLVYGALYFAYEDFLARLVRIAGNKPDFELIERTSPAIAAHFGDAALNDCWKCAPIMTARLVRHALVHNGARLTKNLAKIEHGLQISEDEIYIMPGDTRRLFRGIRDRANRLMKRATEIDRFKRAK